MVRFSELKLYDPVFLNDKTCGIVVGKHETTKGKYITMSFYIATYKKYSIKKVNLEDIKFKPTRDYYLKFVDAEYKFEKQLTHQHEDKGEENG